VSAAEVFAQVDRLDPDAVAALPAQDARLMFGNGEPLVGREAILAGSLAFLSVVKGLRHEIRREWTVGDTTVAEADVTHTRRDDNQVTLAAVSIWRVGADGLMVDFRACYDPAPVFAP
jgi:hypothetical protein